MPILHNNYGSASAFDSTNGPKTENAAPSKKGKGKMSGAANGSTSEAHAKTAFPSYTRMVPPLDMSTVELNGREKSRERSRKSRPFGIPAAPTYYPTEEEFKDPFLFFRKIAVEGSQYGIVKVVPPESWTPEFAINTEHFCFRTRRIALSSVEGANRAQQEYLDGLSRFHRQNNQPFHRLPCVDKKPLDLWKLKKAVDARGGFEKVKKYKKWAEIGRDLGYSGKIMSSLSTSLKNSFQKWLKPYEDWLVEAKPGVKQQLEFENGTSVTPSPANTPHKSQLAPGMSTDESPIKRASHALQATVNGEADHDSKPASPETSKSPNTSSGFTAVNSGGFTAVNGASQKPPARPLSGFTAVNAANNPRSSLSNGDSGATKPREVEQPLPTPPSQSMPNGTIKRPHTSEGEQGAHGDTEADASGRRSKRLRKDGAPSIAGSRMMQPKTSAPRLHPRREHGENWRPGESCDACDTTMDLQKLVVCQGCDYGYHTYCLEPPLNSKPIGPWHCAKCLVGTGEFGFEEGGIYSLKQFQEKAFNFKDSFFRDKLVREKRTLTEDYVEEHFWQLVNDPEESIEVEYGADIHSNTHGSGFPTIERSPRDPYATDPWNLNIMPYHQESLFRHIKSDISGMTVPWLYVGMCFSCFCWHAEDHWTYSANYQHFGDTKTWYGIPSADAKKFEICMRESFPELFETQPDLLWHLTTLKHPAQLRKAGVRVYAVDQHAGEFVITFPQAFHAGFNHGFNFNEAVNFAPSDWEPFGEACVREYQAYNHGAVFSHDELLLTAAADKGTTIKTARWLGPALERMVHREISAREAFFRRITQTNPHGSEETKHLPDRVNVEMDNVDPPEDGHPCTQCKNLAYLSRFECKYSGFVTCLAHAGTFDCCDTPQLERTSGRNKGHVVRMRHTDAQLQNIATKMQEKATIPEAWAEKLDKILDDDPRPQLKGLKSLLNEGERIQHSLPQLHELRKFVEKCQEWVDEATLFITRKQQARRKSEKSWRRDSIVGSKSSSEAREREREFRRVENIERLLAKADELGFDCPEIATLRERSQAIQEFQLQARSALNSKQPRSVEDLEELAEAGKGFNVDIPEVEQLEQFVARQKWHEAANARKERPDGLTLKEVIDILKEAKKLEIPSEDPLLVHFAAQKEAGDIWEEKAKQLISVEDVHLQQLDALSQQAATVPVDPETLASVDAILKKQREAQDHILDLCKRSQEPDYRNRPQYKEVRDLMENLNAINSKPPGMIDLEKAQKRHEDWMRRGKKLFGKANAPLHILLQHMQYVENRNSSCFDVSDKPREQPVEPSSREHTPGNDSEADGPLSSRDVFCICRRVEAGMMIECELCHEWYHGKCLKIARGKVKEDDKYTCPVCDWRKKIPRDAARPKIEELERWQDYIPQLPFQPDEEECLASIIDAAHTFRDFLQPKVNPMIPWTFDDVPNMRFYLRKIEGAEVLLAYETNFFRQELHKWSPVAPEPPPFMEESKSTRKPRPTKQQKLMAQHGVSTVDELPEHLRSKAMSLSRKKSENFSSNGGSAKPTPIKPAGHPGESGPQSGSPTSPSEHHRSSNLPSARSTNSQSGPTFSYNGPATGNSTAFDRSPPMFSQPAGTGFHSTLAGANDTTRMPGLLDDDDDESAGGPNLDPALFAGDPYEAEPHHTTDLEPALGADGDVEMAFHSSQSGGVDTMFAELTNHDDEDGSEGGDMNMD